MINITQNAQDYWYILFSGLTEEGTPYEVKLRYYSYISMWFMDVKCESEDFEVNGIRVANSPNLLESYKNKIDFGIACISQNNAIDPIFLNCFSDGISALYLLNSTEVQQAYEGRFDSYYGVE